MKNSTSGDVSSCGAIKQQGGDGTDHRPEHGRLHPLVAVVGGVADDRARGGGERRRADDDREARRATGIDREANDDAGDRAGEQGEADEQAQACPARVAGGPGALGRLARRAAVTLSHERGGERAGEIVAPGPL